MTNFKPLPTQAELHRLFDYSVITGELYYKIQVSSRALKGSVAGPKKTGKGYKRVRINNVEYTQHRVIWRWVTGDDPGALEIDHKNNQRDCNAWHNLRLATRSQNTANTPGTKGIQKSGASKWKAHIYLNNQYIYLGTHTTKEKASAAYLKAKEELHGEFSPYTQERVGDAVPT